MHERSRQNWGICGNLLLMFSSKFHVKWWTMHLHQPFLGFSCFNPFSRGSSIILYETYMRIDIHDVEVSISAWVFHVVPLELQLIFVITGGHPPPDSIIEVVVPRVISLSLFLTMTVLSSVGIVLTCIFLGFNIKYRHSKWVLLSNCAI